MLLKGGEIMAERSKRLRVYDAEKMKNVNSETLKLFNKYKMDMELRELSSATIAAYESDLSQWFIYIYDNQGNQSITELDEDDVTEFFYYCKKGGNNSRRMRRRMSSISAFYNYLMKKRLIKENPMMFIDRPQKDVDITVQTFLSKEQVELMEQKLQEYVDNGGNLQLQVYALFSLSTMARVTAISNIKWEQINFEERICENVLEKEGKIVTLYFSTKVAELLERLKQYREDNNIDDKGYVFITYLGTKAEAGTLFEWCKRIGKMINIPTLHPHDFRHSGSQLLKLAGCPIEQISELLNHSGLDVTKKFYLRPDQKKIREIKDQFEI